MKSKISVVIPALNVEKTIGNVVTEMKKSKLVEEVIVIDNNSNDKTFDFAKSAGAKVFCCNQQGLGYAMKNGIQRSQTDLIIKIDGDIKDPKNQWIHLLYNCLSENMIFANGYYKSDYDQFPVGTLVAKPSLKLIYPELDYVKMPLSGTYIIRKDNFDLQHTPNNWAFDIAMLLNAHKMKYKIGQVNLGILNDKQKMINEYSEMAYEILKCVIFSK